MHIYAKKGHQVRYRSNGGHDDERAEIERLGIKVGDVLTVSFTRIAKFSTSVAFDEITGLHNSVLFEDILGHDSETGT